jgi:hypothetical protein
MDRQIEFVEFRWERIRAYLESEKAKIYREIRDYPRPVPACDQHFNHLLEKRERISRELERMDEVTKESLVRGDARELLEEFIRSSDFIGRDT